MTTRTTLEDGPLQVAEQTLGLLDAAFETPHVPLRAEATEHLVSIVFRSHLTPNERTLAEGPGENGVRDLRLELHDSMRDPLIAIAEATLGCEVAAFMPAVSVDPPLIVHSYVLASVIGQSVQPLPHA